jgi:cytochrome c-type biogenesis protein CcmH/NrfG
VLLLAIFSSWAKEKLPRAAMSITIVVIVIVGLYTVGTINRNNVWKDNFHLWSDTVKKSPDCAIAHNELAGAYAAQDQLDQAIAEVQTALQLKPGGANGHISLGNLYAAQGQLDRAIAEYQTALRLKPNDYQAQKRLNDIVSQQR